MTQTSNKEFYDSPEEKRWCYRFDVLFIKRDHRQILNRQPATRVKNGRREFWPDWYALKN